MTHKQKKEAASSVERLRQLPISTAAQKGKPYKYSIIYGDSFQGGA